MAKRLLRKAKEVWERLRPEQCTAIYHQKKKVLKKFDRVRSCACTGVLNYNLLPCWTDNTAAQPQSLPLPPPSPPLRVKRNSSVRLARLCLVPSRPTPHRQTQHTSTQSC